MHSNQNWTKAQPEGYPPTTNVRETSARRHFYQKGHFGIVNSTVTAAEYRGGAEHDFRGTAMQRMTTDPKELHKVLSHKIDSLATALSAATSPRIAAAMPTSWHLSQVAMPPYNYGNMQTGGHGLLVAVHAIVRQNRTTGARSVVGRSREMPVCRARAGCALFAMLLSHPRRSTGTFGRAPLSCKHSFLGLRSRAVPTHRLSRCSMASVPCVSGRQL